MPKKAPGNRIANFLNLNQCTIKYQNCQKKAPGKLIDNKSAKYGSRVLDCNIFGPQRIRVKRPKMSLLYTFWVANSFGVIESL